MSTPRRKALFVSNLFPDSVETYRGLDNAKVIGLLAKDYDFRVISPRPSLPFRQRGELAAREADQEFTPRYLKVPYIPKLGSRFNHRLMARPLGKAMAALKREFEFEFVLSAWLFPDGWAATTSALALGVPAIQIAQGTDVHGYLKHPVRRKRILEAVGRASYTVTRSRSLTDLLISAGADANKVGPIHNGADLSIFHPRDKAATRRELGVPERGGLLLFVGNLLPVKNPLMLIDALSQLAQCGERPHLVMVGMGPMEPQIRDRIASLGLEGQVTLTGGLPATEVARWMSAADLLCMTSHNEGLPNVVIEALASGLRILATNVGGIGELVDDSAKGVLAKPSDVSAYAHQLQRLLAAPTTVSGDSSDLANYSWQRCAENYRTVIEKAAPQNVGS